jgi:hypothetical protein
MRINPQNQQKIQTPRPIFCADREEARSLFLLKKIMYDIIFTSGEGVILSPSGLLALDPRVSVRTL